MTSLSHKINYRK